MTSENTLKEQAQRLVTFETLDQSDEETWYLYIHIEHEISRGRSVCLFCISDEDEKDEGMDRLHARYTSPYSAGRRLKHTVEKSLKHSVEKSGEIQDKEWDSTLGCDIVF